MNRGNRGPGSPSRRRWAFRPTSEGLEDRKLLASTPIDLSTTQVANPANTPPGPLGVELVGKATDNTAGYTITDVGNVTGSGYDSFVISAPGLTTTPVGGAPIFGAGESAAYLVFGSKAVNVNTVSDYLNLAGGLPNTPVGTPLTSGQRAGDLGQLGTLGLNNAGQFNPTVVQPTTGTATVGFNFDGLTLVTGLDSTTGLGRNSGLGFSVTPLGDINKDGFDDFAISAPNDTGGGRVFVIYGGSTLATQATTSKTIDLEPTVGTTTGTAPTKVVSFAIPNAAATTEVGYSVAGIGNFFNTPNGRDLGIGVPGLNNNTGAVYAVPNTYVNNLASGTSVDLTTLTGVSGTGGIEYTGVTAGDRVGSAVSTAGSFDGAASGTLPLDSLLIGAPDANGGGTVYLVYSLQDTIANNTLGTVQSLSTLGVAPTTNPITTPLQGVVYFDGTAGDGFGTTVASAGDFSGDGIDDIMVGAPGVQTGTGTVSVIYGVKGTSTTTPTRLNGIFAYNPSVPSAGSVSYLGQGTLDFAGFSIAPSAHVNLPGAATTSKSPNSDILIGAPGYLANQGTAYIVTGTVPGSTPPTGLLQLANISNAPAAGGTAVAGLQFGVTGTSDIAIRSSGGAFGTSVSARNPVIDANTLTTTVDNDSVPDFFFGAPFSSLVNPTSPTSLLRSRAGVGYVVEGALIGATSTGTGTGTGTGTTTANVLVSPTAASLLASPIFTGEDAGLPFPPVDALEHLGSYAPLPVTIAYQQFREAPGFLARQQAYQNPGKGDSHQAPRGIDLDVAAIGRSENKYLRHNTLPKAVFTRGKFKKGQTITFTHKVKVIPRSEQTEELTSA